jgi:hypothetical protein
VFIFLAWRVSRGGRYSRGLLILATGLTYIAALLDVARAWDAPVFVLVIVYAVLMALVLSPVVYRRCHRDQPGRTGGLAWPVPPAWLLLGGIAAGIIVTLCYLSSMDWQAVPGCGPAGATIAQLPGHCFTLARGFPLRFLSAGQNVPEISYPAMVRDWVQWSLVSCSALYFVIGCNVSAGAVRTVQA